MELNQAEFFLVYCCIILERGLYRVICSSPFLKQVNHLRKLKILSLFFENSRLIFEQCAYQHLYGHIRPIYSTPILTYIFLPYGSNPPLLVYTNENPRQVNVRFSMLSSSKTHQISEHVVRHVSTGIAQCSCSTVREYDRCSCGLQCCPHSSRRYVREIHQHAKSVQLPYDCLLVQQIVKSRRIVSLGLFTPLLG